MFNPRQMEFQCQLWELGNISLRYQGIPVQYQQITRTGGESKDIDNTKKQTNKKKRKIYLNFTWMKKNKRKNIILAHLQGMFTVIVN